MNVLKTHKTSNPPGFVSLAWSSDLQKFGISIKQLYNPGTKAIGVSFKRGKVQRSVVFGGRVEEKAVTRAIRSVEVELGVPDHASRYSGKRIKPISSYK